MHRDRTKDPLFFGRMLRVFLTFGPHPSRVPRWTSAANLRVRPTDRGDRTFFIWERTKEGEALNTHVEIEVPQAYVPWLAGWLDQEKPRNRRTYVDLFHELEVATREQTGYDIHANPLRARHTCAQQMLERGFTTVDVQAAIRVSPITLQTYGMSTPEQRGAKGEEVGWGNWE